MEKIQIQVCIGTTCYLLGAANFDELITVLERKFKDKIEVKTTSCLGLCSKDEKSLKSPYVKIDDEIISEATIEKVTAAINRKLNYGNK